MMPPEPIRIVEVPAPMKLSATAVAALAMPGHVVMLCHPISAIAEPLGVAGELQAVSQGLPGVAALDDGGQIEDGELGHTSGYRFGWSLA